jgi:hypothetical protein
VGDLRADPAIALRLLRIVDDLGQLVLGLVDAGHVGEGGALPRCSVMAARRAETSFEEHTAVPEARLEKTEDYLEAAAHKAEMEAAERDAQVRERIAQAHEHVSEQRQ